MRGFGICDGTETKPDSKEKVFSNISFEEIG